ncbi:MAG: hypothetical protein M0Z39_01075 [Actinomycetota bacterium]|nr:hypothetical protein [Actinomycetota bacterium]
MQHLPKIAQNGIVRIFCVAATSAPLALGFYLISRSPVSAVLFGLVSAIFLAAGVADLRTGRIRNSYMATAATAAVILQITANGFVGGLIRIAVVLAAWSVVAPIWRRPTRTVGKQIGGGDLKMIGVTWLVLAAFPFGLALILLLIWAMGVLVATLVSRLAGRRRLRAGMLLALVALGVWTLGLASLS